LRIPETGRAFFATPWDRWDWQGLFCVRVLPTIMATLNLQRLEAE
jgi:hypothetical protein